MKKYLILILICFSFCSDENKLITQKGFFLYVDERDLTFVPVKSGDIRNILNTFNTENLGKGFHFMPYVIGLYYNKLISNCDTLVVNNYLGYKGKNEYLKITPVIIDYIILSDEKPKTLPYGFKSIEIYNINNNEVEFKIDLRNIKVNSITPINLSK